MSDSNMNNTMDNVDEAIAKAQAVQREKLAQVEGEAVKATTTRVKLTVAERKARADEAEATKAKKKLAREKVRAQKTAERELAKKAKNEERAAKKLAKAAQKLADEANKPAAHMSKVEKAAAKLPQLDDTLQENLVELTENFTVPELSRLVAHLAHSNRVASTLASKDIEFDVGDRVRIVASESDPSLIGQEGVISEMRKIRVLLDVEGINHSVYLFASDCESLEEVEEEDTDEDSDDEVVSEDDVEGTEVDEEGFLQIEDGDEDECEDETGTDG